MQPSNVMTIDELADYLKVAKSSLYKLAQEGKLPAQKVGKHWRFSREAIDRWLAEQPQASRAELDSRERGGRDAS